MDNLKKTNKESGKAQLALLIAVAVAAGAAGVWSELHAAGVSVTKQATSYIQVSGSVGGGSASGSIQSQPDGTAWVSVNANIGSDWVDGSDSANTTYALSVNASPGQSGKPGSGTGSAILAGNSWLSGPVVLGVDMSVLGAADASAFNVHQVQVWTDPNTGNTTATRVTQIGSQAWGNTAGSISVTVNGSPFASGTGVSGQVVKYSTHIIERLQ